jgi:hypothetical protein
LAAGFDVSCRIMFPPKAREVLFCLLLFISPFARAQTNPATLTPDGAWTWYNDPRALYHNGILYFGYVRADGRSALSAFNPARGVSTLLFTSSWSETDDHDNAGLLRMQDGRLLAIYAHHSSVNYFNYRTSLSTNPVTPADWSAEQTFTTTAGVTYSNPYQLATESGLIYNFMRDLNFNPTVTTSTNGRTSNIARTTATASIFSTRTAIRATSPTRFTMPITATGRFPKRTVRS